ncbi:MAG: PKD domain-containing protein [Paracoccaceae bacterium]
MSMVRICALFLALLLPGLATTPALAQITQDSQVGSLVLYGPKALSREGDDDKREQIFFSVPATTRDRLFVRILDPEVSGRDDFAYGGTADSETTFRVFGGDGAFTQAERPVRQEPGTRPEQFREAIPITGPGQLIREQAWGNDPKTDGRWITLTPLRAAQGEVVGDRAYFRLDIQGTGGNDANVYNVAVSVSRDRNRKPEGLEMFAYQPTVRWREREPATQVWFRPEVPGPYAIQTFDAALGTVTVVTDFEDLPVVTSGQDIWAVDMVDTGGEDNLALSLMGGRETPNDVTMGVFDANGNPIPLDMPPVRAPSPSRPSAQATARPLADCRAVAFDASMTEGRVPLSFLWDFGDGNRSTEPVIAHRYTDPGQYTARLEVLENGTRPGRGDFLEVPVHVRNAPVAVPGPETIVAPGQALTFDGSGSIPSDSPIKRYKWSFGDGSQANGALAQKAYDTPGQYRAVLRVEDDADHPCNFGVETRRIIVNFPPVAEAGTNQSAIVGQAMNFTGTASYDIDGMVDAYVWDMGDGTRLEGASVSHAFERSGTYQVTLTVTDDSGVANSTARDVMLVEVNDPPQPRFAVPPRALSVSEIGTLDATESTDGDGQIISYLWDFGDGAVAEGPIVNYAWNQPGVYPVTLTVIDDSGTASALQSIEQNIRIDAAPVANAGADQYVTATEVRFDGGGSTDADGVVTTWEWDFGDGNTASGRVVKHAYQSTGRYQVTLLVTDDSGAPLNFDRDTMSVSINESPIADAGPAQVVAPGEQFVVSGRASVDPDGEIASYVWDFPDGSSVQGQRAAYAISEPGLHRIRLTVFDDFEGGAADDESETLVTVNTAPTAIAGADRLVAPGDLVIFDGGQSYDPDGPISEFAWDFDDLQSQLKGLRIERAYESPGVYSVQLVVADGAGVVNSTAVDDLTVRVNHAPVADAGKNIKSDRLFVEFDASGSSDADGDKLIYRWDFGDGSAPVFGEKVKHVFPRSGIYPVTLRVDDGTGVANATSTAAISVNVNSRPMAVAGGNRDVCSGEPILFDASDSVDPDGGLLLYTWDFGDGTSSDLVNPTKTFERPGTYPVTLSVRNETGTARGSDIDRIAALVRPGPIADAGQDRRVCSNQRVRFDGSGSTDSDGAVNAYEWAFGDGNTGGGESPFHIFKRAGTYTVTLTITGEANGSCSPFDTDTTQIEVVPAPALTIDGPSAVGLGLHASFAAKIAELGEAQPGTFSWDFGDGTTATGEGVDHTYSEPGEYVVTLSTQLTGGFADCSNLTATQRIIVNEAPTALIDGPDAVAAGQALAFDASMSMDVDGVITSYAWDFGDGTKAEGVLAAHTYTAPGTYDVTLSVTDDADVQNSQAVAMRQVRVNPAPRVGLQAPTAICPGVPQPWAVTVDAGTSVNWLFGDGTTATGPSATHGFDRPGLFPVVVQMDDGKGLPNSRQSEEVYVRVNRSPTALAGPDRIVCPGEVVTFDAGSSNDLDGELVGFVWEFSDGVVLEGKTVDRVFDDPADLMVRLSVRDDSGTAQCSIGTDEARVLVNSAPLVDAGPDITVPVGGAHDVVRFDGSGARDVDGQGLLIGWNFGDGSVAASAIARHRYTTPGEYTVTVRAQDSTGLECGISTDTAIIRAVERDVVSGLLPKSE